MRKSALSVIVFALSLIAVPAMAGQLFPPQNAEGTSKKCPEYTSLVWSTVGDGGHVECQDTGSKITGLNCPSGQVMIGINNGAPICSSSGSYISPFQIIKNAAGTPLAPDYVYCMFDTGASSGSSTYNYSGDPSCTDPSGTCSGTTDYSVDASRSVILFPLIGFTTTNRTVSWNKGKAVTEKVTQLTYGTNERYDSTRIKYDVTPFYNPTSEANEFLGYGGQLDPNTSYINSVSCPQQILFDGNIIAGPDLSRPFPK